MLRLPHPSQLEQSRLQPEHVQPQPRHMKPEYLQTLPSPQPSHSSLVGFAKLMFGILLIYVAFHAQQFGYLSSMINCDNELVGYAAAELSSAVVVLLGIVILGGWRSLEFRFSKVRGALRDCVPLLVVDGALGLFVLGTYLVHYHSQLVDGWALNLLAAAIMCLGVGLTEEGMFRGLLLGGLLDIFGKRKAGIWFALIASATAFGCVHVLPPDEGTVFDVLTISQMVLKIIQTGICGALWGATITKHGDIHGVAVAHAFSDFFLMVGTALFAGAEATVSTDYVSTGSEAAISSIIFYLVTIAFYIPQIIKTYRIMREIEAPNYGILAKDSNSE